MYQQIYLRLPSECKPQAVSDVCSGSVVSTYDELSVCLYTTYLPYLLLSVI